MIIMRNPWWFDIGLMAWSYMFEVGLNPARGWYGVSWDSSQGLPLSRRIPQKRRRTLTAWRSSCLTVRWRCNAMNLQQTYPNISKHIQTLQIARRTSSSKAWSWTGLLSFIMRLDTSWHVQIKQFLGEPFRIVLPMRKRRSQAQAQACSADCISAHGVLERSWKLCKVVD